MKKSNSNKEVHIVAFRMFLGCYLIVEFSTGTPTLTGRIILAYLCFILIRYLWGEVIERYNYYKTSNECA
ncbi:MAG: hypothetical protein ABIH79_01080 [archaeon]